MTSVELFLLTQPHNRYTWKPMRVDTLFKGSFLLDTEWETTGKAQTAGVVPATLFHFVAVG